ncbi:hypothetical protein D9M69_516040 [compost metagenome]
MAAIYPSLPGRIVGGASQPGLQRFDRSPRVACGRAGTGPMEPGRCHAGIVRAGRAARHARADAGQHAGARRPVVALVWPESELEGSAGRICRDVLPRRCLDRLRLGGGRQPAHSPRHAIRRVRIGSRAPRGQRYDSVLRDARPGWAAGAGAVPGADPDLPGLCESRPRQLRGPVGRTHCAMGRLSAQPRRGAAVRRVHL